MQKAKIFGWLAAAVAVSGVAHTAFRAVALYTDRALNSAPWTVALLWPGCAYLVAVTVLVLLFFCFSRPNNIR